MKSYKRDGNNRIVYSKDMKLIELIDADYELFKKKLIASGFSYDMRSSKMLKQLKDMIKFEGYEEITKDDIASLEGKLQQNLGHSLEHFATHIKRLIGDEIVKRYYGQKGGVVYNLRDDTDIEEAFKILSDGERYKKILAPQQNEDI